MNDKNVMVPDEKPEQISVLLFADDSNSKEYLDVVTKTSAAVIAASKEDRLAVMVCTHADSDKKSVVLCIVYPSEDGKSVSYAPAAQLFDESWAPWQTMLPPECALSQ